MCVHHGLYYKMKFLLWFMTIIAYWSRTTQGTDENVEQLECSESASGNSKWF